MTRRRNASISYLSSISSELIELGLGAGVLGVLEHALALALLGSLQAADLRIFVDRHEAGVVGVGLEPLGQDLFGLFEIAVVAIELGELDIGMDGLGVADDFLDQALLGRELFLLEPFELGVQRLGRLGSGGLSVVCRGRRQGRRA